MDRVLLTVVSFMSKNNHGSMEFWNVFVDVADALKGRRSQHLHMHNYKSIKYYLKIDLFAIYCVQVDADSFLSALMQWLIKFL